MRSRESFERFYYTKVGLGEACGCAEKVIDVYELNRSGGALQKPVNRLGVRRRWSFRSLALKYGLISRPRG
ncbi:hypothetical protein FGK63_08785 [Ruegeria sediminis]|uniref:Uncharacterized protein n=1 Tax=Ruegeria sediminis TaxID=2583820 RepID=A0ABY2WXG7_9RHOB|nr:hypothetical protein [Ruegeria sediminis]TMV07556.1 hypothetical protein FGK63_08785 [Ruegeria sediminis]